MCADYCDCYWCVVGHMAGSDQFKQRLERLVDEFKETDEFKTIQERSLKAQLAFKEED
jgi:hypothetical protein